MIYAEQWLDTLSEKDMLKLIESFLDKSDIKPQWDEYVEELYHDFLTTQA